MECPVCKEVIKKGALMCRFCGSDLRRFYEMNENIFSGDTISESTISENTIFEGSENTIFEGTPSDSITTVEKNIYRRKIDFVNR
jgi:hypothetical protein